MPMKAVIPAGSGKPLASYSPGAMADGVLYVSGTLPFDEDDDVVHLGGAEFAGRRGPAAFPAHRLVYGGALRKAGCRDRPWHRSFPRGGKPPDAHRRPSCLLRARTLPPSPPAPSSPVLAEGLSNARLWITETGGHAFTVEQPEPFNRVLVDFPLGG
jgi:pimeloyl-ACP methyl ester carboxylesterase